MERLADRYGVSLTAVILRWLEYTETRALVVVSNEGFALWSKPSTSALRTGRFIRTKNAMFELPSASIARSRLGTTPAVRSADQPSNVWFDEPVFETSLRADRLDLEITLIQFDRLVEPLQEEKSDLADRMNAPRW